MHNSAFLPWFGQTGMCFPPVKTSCCNTAFYKTSCKNSIFAINFTNILSSAFSYKSFTHSSHVLTIQVCTFWRKNIGAKAAYIMLVKLTPVVTKLTTNKKLSTDVKNIEVQHDYMKLEIKVIKIGRISHKTYQCLLLLLLSSQFK